MRKIFTIILILAASVLIGGMSSCMLNCVHGSGHQQSENRKVTDFSKISISGSFKVVLKQDSSFALKVTGDDNLLKYIKTEVSNGKLRIYSRRNMCNSGELAINIGIRNLEELKASGAVDVTSDGKITAQDLHFNLSGATKVNMDLNAANVTTTGSGATELTLRGQATSHDIDLSGVGHVYALDFVVGDCEIQTRGMGETEVNVLHSLKVNSSGASDTKYRGNPSITHTKSGASSIEKVN